MANYNECRFNWETARHIRTHTSYQFDFIWGKRGGDVVSSIPPCLPLSYQKAWWEPKLTENWYWIVLIGRKVQMLITWCVRLQQCGRLTSRSTKDSNSLTRMTFSISTSAMNSSGVAPIYHLMNSAWWHNLNVHSTLPKYWTKFVIAVLIWRNQGLKNKRENKP